MLQSWPLASSALDMKAMMAPTTPDEHLNQCMCGRAARQVAELNSCCQPHTQSMCLLASFGLLEPMWGGGLSMPGGCNGMDAGEPAQICGLGVFFAVKDLIA